MRKKIELKEANRKEVKPLEEVKEIPRPATLQRMQFSILYEIVETGSVHRTAGILNVKVS